MKPQSNYVLMGLCLAALSGPLGGRAATIWNGPPMTFTKAGFADPTQPANQDRLTPNVWLTRDNTEGLYNKHLESSYDKLNRTSPVDTEWAYGTTANYASLTYGSWYAWTAAFPPGTVGKDAVVHLISEDIYLDIKFLSWGGSLSGGAFSYQRSTPSAVNQPPTVAIDSPTNGASFTAPAVVPIIATADDSDGSVTNVAFFDNGASLGGTNATPYTVTASLATGSHALTAVATDNLGLSTTSSPPVNVTVGAGNPTFSVTLTNPPDNSVFGNTDRVPIGASASDTDGTVTNVQFFDGTVLLRSVSTSPYSFTNGPFTFALGLHTLTAVASDNLGARATSAPVHLTVARYLPPITNGDIAILLQPVATGMAAPLYGINPPGDTHRLFVLEQNGLVRIIQDGTLLPVPALDIQSRVQPPLNASNPNDERGLLGLAFHPGFNNPASPGYQTLYTYNSEMIPANTTPTYPVPTTATNNYRNVINEWKISAENANVIDPSSRREVISFGKTAGNHNGGTCTFGPDNYMYLALGDGGDANDVGASHIVPGGNAQNLSTPLGKFLRFDPLHPALNPTSSDLISSNGQYRIPATNPFQEPGQVPEIYAYGLRNPYRFCFDFVTGELIHADVGQNNVEEIDRIIRGGNYGWAVKEGDFLFNQTNGPSGPAGTIGAPPGNRSPGFPASLIDPISGTLGTLEYDHNEGISITGGFVYRGTAIPELYGKYIFGDLALRTAPVRADGRLFYADLQTGLIKAFPLPQFGGTAVLPNGLTVHGFGQDADGELYALVTNTSANGTGGIVYKLARALLLKVQASGNLLDISWSATGGHLEAQTNSPSAGLGANWVTVPGSETTNRVVAPIDAANGSVFYRLAIP
jgi:glucose/arabinose dehydrogenase